MKRLVEYLEQMYIECRIPFEVYIDEEKIFKTNPDFPKNNLVEIRFLIGNKSCRIETEENYKKFLKILKFCIENRYEENYSMTEKIIIELLENSYVSKEKIKEIMPVIEKDIYLVTISVKDKLSESLDILKNIYNTEIIILKHKNSIVLIGIFEDIEEHMSSISETLYTSIYEKCYISYCNIEDYKSLHFLYEDNIYKINLAKKYNISSRLFDGNSLLFEKVIDSLGEESKNKIIDKFNDGFSKLDEEIIKTIDIFFKVDLNLSEAAKQLYVHRNTLIYRLDKIQKYTSYDIRKFNDAALFRIAFFIWKYKNRV